MAKKRTKKQVKKTKRPVKRQKIRNIKRTSKVKKAREAVRSKAKIPRTHKLYVNKIKPIFAGLLNFLIWGTGYMYAGKTIYGLLWLAVAVCVMIPFTQILPMLPASITGYMSVGYFLISVLLAWDAYVVESRKIKLNPY